MTNRFNNNSKNSNLYDRKLYRVNVRDFDDNPSFYYSPPYTRVKRCSGCCGSDLVSCQPTVVEILNFEASPTVLYCILQYNETFTFKEKKIVTIEQHVKCKCDCMIKKHRMKRNANSEQEDKFWVSKTCMCRYIKEQECTTGFVFNYNTCKYEPTEDTL